MICSLYRSLSFSLKLGTDGVGYSSVAQSLIIFILTVTVSLQSISMKPWHLFKILRHEYSWLNKWSKQGFFSGLDSLIRNSVYLIVVIRTINLLDEQALYWIANTLIWNWLLLPVLALTELLKQDVSTNHPEHKFETIIPVYIIISFGVIVVWMITAPGPNIITVS